MMIPWLNPRWPLAILPLLLVLAGCSHAPEQRSIVAATTASPGVPTPTLPPTTIPGSLQDEREVADRVRQFGAAVTRGDEVVALLILTPSAQQIVAASDLSEFLGRAERPQSFTVLDVRLDGDVATADCLVRYASHEQPLRLQLVRLEGVWKIDAQVSE